MAQAEWPTGRAKVAERHGQRSIRLYLNEFRLIAYATGNFGKNLLLSACDTTLLFLLTDRLGVAAGTVAQLMFVALVGDLILDFASGMFVTWVRSRGMRYRLLLVVGAAPCGMAFAFLFGLPWLGLVRFWPLAIALLAFRGAYSFIDVPHNSMLADITHDSRGRGRASGYRYFFSAIAGLTLANTLTPVVVSSPSFRLPAVLAGLGLAGGFCICVVMLIAAMADRTPKPVERQDRLKLSTMLPNLDGLSAAMGAIALVTGFAMPMFGRTLLYVSTYLLHRPAFASVGATAITIGQVCGVLLWTLLLRRFEKTTLLLAGHLVLAIATLAFALSGPNPQLDLTFAFLIGVGMASVFMLPWAILADAVDFAEFRHRGRREAAAFAAFLVAIKTGGAATSWFVGSVMATLHYRPGVTQTPTVEVGLRLLAFGVPIAGSLAMILILMGVRINYRRHARVVRLLEKRRSARDAVRA